MFTDVAGGPVGLAHFEGTRCGAAGDLDRSALPGYPL